MTRSTTKIKSLLLILGVFIIFTYGCETMGVKPNGRIEQFPEGEQTSYMKAFLVGSPTNPVPQDRQFAAPYNRVWDDMKNVTRTFNKTEKKKKIKIDEEYGRIQIGEINQDATIGLSSGAWLDEIFMEATSVDKTTTKVSVSRRVVRYIFDTTSGKHYWQGQWSNGNVETWLLTQIEDNLNKYIGKQSRDNQDARKKNTKKIEPVEKTAPVAQQNLPNNETKKDVTHTQSGQSSSVKLGSENRNDSTEMVKIKKNLSSVKVHPTPDTKKHYIATLKGGSEVEKFDEKGDWINIRFTDKDSQKEGWINKYSLEGYNKVKPKKEKKAIKQKDSDKKQLSPL